MLKNLGILTICALLLIGCGTSSYLEQTSNESQVARKFIPRAFRGQIFSNTPTAYNQNMQDGERNTRSSTDRYENIASGKGDSYGQGFEDGCQTYMGIMGEGFYRWIGNRFKPYDMVNDPWYLRGFQDGSTFCTFRTDWETH